MPKKYDAAQRTIRSAMDRGLVAFRRNDRKSDSSPSNLSQEFRFQTDGAGVVVEASYEELCARLDGASGPMVPFSSGTNRIEEHHMMVDSSMEFRESNRTIGPECAIEFWRKAPRNLPRRPRLLHLVLTAKFLIRFVRRRIHIYDHSTDATGRGPCERNRPLPPRRTSSGIPVFLSKS